MDWLIVGLILVTAYFGYRAIDYVSAQNGRILQQREELLTEIHHYHLATRQAVIPAKKPQVWGVWCRYQIAEFGNSKLIEAPIGTYSIHPAKTNTVTLELMPQHTGKLREVRVYGGPWLIDDILIGRESLKAGSDTLADSTQAIFLDRTVELGQRVTVRLSNPYYHIT